MTPRKKAKRAIPGTLFLVITLAAFLAISSAAFAAGGVTPSQAVPLADDVNTGKLNPGEQHWYKFTLESGGQPNDVQKSLTLVLTPDMANVKFFTSLKIFEANQIAFFSNGDASNMTHIGAGSVVERDTNPETGELIWTGWVSTEQTYYIQVLNDSDFPIDYWLFNADVVSPPLTPPQEPAAEPIEPPTPQEEPQAPEEPQQPEEAPVTPENPDIGNTPENPDHLTPGRTEGKLAPNATKWYALHYPDFSGDKNLQELDFSLFFTPDDGHRRHYVNFELYAASELNFWRRGDVDQMTNFGAGMQVSRDGDYNTGERIWRGVVLSNNDYLLAVRNGADVDIDYYIYEDDIYNPILGPLPEPAPLKVFAPGASPQTALPMKIGENVSGLAPGEEAWYSFRIADFDEEEFEQMAITLIATPDDGNRIRNLTFDVFTAGGVQYWSPGDNTQIDNIGAGSVVYRDDNPLTGERFWSGWVVDNDLYLVQVRNGTDTYMDYHLYTGDVYRPELGEKTTSVAKVAAQPGTAPSAPVELKLGVNRGILEPGEEAWYSFSRTDVDASGRVDTAFTLVFTPDDGNRIRDINFELFEGNQLRDWAPDNRFTVANFGKGSVVDRDGRPNTGELLWTGQVFAGDLYYMRVSNESDATIQYLILPDDVIQADIE